ncbi:Hypothetical predicted protein [Paramuricea clavata]|uniref:Uncharacterized protein n=1 Tax=Paramuricea clavata TaxID=317549 RepID=A0A6S7HL39_PARCT|nr:Hypothetical predicted protein [Paramuricea clavata]
MFGIEERVKEYIRGISKSNGQASGENKATSPQHRIILCPQSASVNQLPEEPQTSSQVSTPEANTSTLQQEEIQEIPSPTSNVNSTVETKIGPITFDSWIDKLKEFEEIKVTLPVDGSQMSIADALLNRDIPKVTLTKFSGNPLEYADFIDCRVEYI